MPSLQYKAVDPLTGQVIKNTVTGAITKQELYNKLKDNGLTPIEINTTFGLNINKKSIAQQTENGIDMKIKKKIKVILIPQIVQLIAITLLLIIGLALIFPNIENIVNHSNMQLELPEIINIIANTWYYIVLAILVLTLIGVMYTKTEQFQYKWNLLKDRVAEDSEFNLDKYLYEISKKISKIIYISSAILLIFFILTALVPSVQLYLTSIK